METKTKFNAKQFAGRMIADYLEKMEVLDSTKLKALLKVSQSDASLAHGYLTILKAELVTKLTKEKAPKEAKEA